MSERSAVAAQARGRRTAYGRPALHGLTLLRGVGTRLWWKVVNQQGAHKLGQLLRQQRLARCQQIRSWGPSLAVCRGAAGQGPDRPHGRWRSPRNPPPFAGTRDALVKDEGSPGPQQDRGCRRATRSTGTCQGVTTSSLTPDSVARSTPAHIVLSQPCGDVQYPHVKAAARGHGRGGRG